jgi:hypothetical protein
MSIVKILFDLIHVNFIYNTNSYIFNSNHHAPKKLYNLDAFKISKNDI